MQVSLTGELTPTRATPRGTGLIISKRERTKNTHRMMAKSDMTWHGACMKSFNVTMPEELLEYVRQRTRDGGFGTPTEFMRDLIRRDRDAQGEVEIERRLLEGVKSPRSRVGKREFFRRMHALIDEVAERTRGQGRNGKATRSTARGR